MNSTDTTYRIRKKGRQHGDVFTKPDVVSYMLDIVDYTPNRDLSTISIMEPSCGNGDFLFEILRRLYCSAQKFHFDFYEAFKKNIFASDIDEKKIQYCLQQIKTTYPQLINPDLKIVVEDYLLHPHELVDIVIGNPPYIRYELIPEKTRCLYKQNFSTFYYRPDIYILFYEHSLAQLKPNGKHCFICSNRWIKNQYGKKLRDLISHKYHLETLLNMESVNAFDENVLAYPAITLINKDLSSKKTFCGQISKLSDLSNVSLRMFKTPYAEDWKSLFFDKDMSSSNFSSIEEQGFHIGIGVATGADKVFISTDIQHYVEKDLLLPVINARNLQGNKIQWNGQFLLNPYDSTGNLIYLDHYPKAKAYLEKHCAQLSSRYKAQKNPTKWYGTIDKISPSLLSEPKILLPDVSGNTRVFVDNGNFYPQHNLYYINGGTKEQLQILAALLMSNFVQNQIHSLTNHINGGYARWQCQYLRKLIIPRLSSIPKNIIKQLLTNYHANNVIAINKLVERLCS